MLNLALWLKKNAFKAGPGADLPAVADGHRHRDVPLGPQPAAQGHARGAAGRRRGVVPKRQKQRDLHKAFLRCHDPTNWPLLREALQRMGRVDLIGNGPECLVPAGKGMGMSEGKSGGDAKGKGAPKGDSAPGSVKTGGGGKAKTPAEIVRIGRAPGRARLSVKGRMAAKHKLSANDKAAVLRKAAAKEKAAAREKSEAKGKPVGRELRVVGRPAADTAERGAAETGRGRARDNAHKSSGRSSNTSSIKSSRKTSPQKPSTTRSGPGGNRGGATGGGGSASPPKRGRPRGRSR